MLSERGSVGERKRLFWKVKEALSETNVAKMKVDVGHFQEIKLQMLGNQYIANVMCDVGFLFENRRRQE